MSVFDSIISENNQKFGSGSETASLLSALLRLITDQSQGGLGGFLDRFRRAGLGNAADSWISAGDNITLSNGQVESALGSDTVGLMTERAGIDAERTKSILGSMIPGVVDRLTPDGIVPANDDLLTRIGNYSAGEAPVSNFRFDAPQAELNPGETFDRFDGAAGVRSEISGAHSSSLNRVEEEIILDDNSPLRWLVPLIILALLIAVGWAFCGNSPSPTASIEFNRISVDLISIT